MAFLNQGKGLYIDGNNFFFDNKETEVSKMSGCKHDGWGSPLTDNITALNGIYGTITSGKSYSFISGTSINASIDHITSKGASIILTCQDKKGRAAVYGGPNGSYRLVYLSFVFGNIRGQEQKYELMNSIMKYLTGGTTSIMDGQGKENKSSTVSIELIPGLYGKGSLCITLSEPSWVYLDYLGLDGSRVGKTEKKYLFSGKNELSFSYGQIGRSGSGLRILKVVNVNGCESKALQIPELRDY